VAVVKPKQQWNALASMMNKYPTNPITPNKRAKFASTNFIKNLFKVLFTNLRTQREKD
jgi:hypothetical protein